MKTYLFPVAMGVALSACGISTGDKTIQFFVLFLIAAAWGNWK